MPITYDSRAVRSAIRLYPDAYVNDKGLVHDQTYHDLPEVLCSFIGEIVHEGSDGPTITTSNLGTFTYGVPFSGTVAATNLPELGTYSWNIDWNSSSDPDGVVWFQPDFGDGSGNFTGIITDDTAVSGTYTVNLLVIGDGAVTLAEKDVSITIVGKASGSPVAGANGDSDTSAVVDEAYSKQLLATGTGPITWTLMDEETYGSLPPGITLSTSGLLSGTPTANGNFDFYAQASNASGVLIVVYRIFVSG